MKTSTKLYLSGFIIQLLFLLDLLDMSAFGWSMTCLGFILTLIGFLVDKRETRAQ